jgi:PiT family inorganic phosphate transporter
VDIVLIAVVVTVALAILFDFTNGFHDSANSTSTVVATRSLSPRVAVGLAAIFNFLPAFLVGTLVANTIAKTVNLDNLATVSEHAVPLGVRVSLAALLGAILWNFFTWSKGLPSSSSHALIGGLVGAGLAAGGTDAVNWRSLEKIVIAIFTSPAVALVVAVLAVFLIRFIQNVLKLSEDSKVFQVAQIASSCWVSWDHGLNDAQKTMGVVAATLYSAGYLAASDASQLDPPTWVIFGAHLAIAAGTFYGGWAIIETLGLKITRVTRATGTAANIGAIVAISGASRLGIPISTTQSVTASIVGSGVGARRRVHWGVMGRMAIAWFVTLPAGAVVGFSVYQVMRLPGTLASISTGAVIIALLTYAGYLMRNAIGADDVAAELPSEEDLARRDGQVDRVPA